jgi:hypothetical protein
VYSSFSRKMGVCYRSGMYDWCNVSCCNCLVKVDCEKRSKELKEGKR